MILRDDLNAYLSEYLHIEDFDDLGPNGLQVEGRREIHKIVTAVSASAELFERAIKLSADALLVHHGIIWYFERPLYRGSYKKRIRMLLENDLNLFAYHLPLDAHEEAGNNIRIARLLGLKSPEPFGEYKKRKVGYRGIFPKEQSAEEIFQRIKANINPRALIFPYGPDVVKTVGVISGGAQKEVQQAVAEGLDLYITGEVSEHILHYVKEEGIHFVAAGHYATERFGVQALGEHLQQKFALNVEFVDLPNPV